MIPIDFKESNSTLLGGRAEKYQTSKDVLNLHVWKDGREIISLWRASWRERWSVLVFGKVWLRVATPKTHPPVCLEGTQTIFACTKEPEGEKR